MRELKSPVRIIIALLFFLFFFVGALMACIMALLPRFRTPLVILWTAIILATIFLIVAFWTFIKIRKKRKRKFLRRFARNHHIPRHLKAGSSL